MIISAPLDNEFKEMSERLLGKQACPAAGQHAMGLAVSRGEEGCVCTVVWESHPEPTGCLWGNTCF